MKSLASAPWTWENIIRLRNECQVNVPSQQQGSISASSAGYDINQCSSPSWLPMIATFQSVSQIRPRALSTITTETSPHYSIGGQRSLSHIISATQEGEGRGECRDRGHCDQRKREQEQQNTKDQKNKWSQTKIKIRGTTSINQDCSLHASDAFPGKRGLHSIIVQSSYPRHTEHCWIGWPW